MARVAKSPGAETTVARQRSKSALRRGFRKTVDSIPESAARSAKAEVRPSRTSKEDDALAVSDLPSPSPVVASTQDVQNELGKDLFEQSHASEWPILHDIHTVERHLAFNVHVKTGYRSASTPVWASFVTWHNETTNIYTHLFGALLCFYWLVWCDFPRHEPHYVVVSIADAASMVCFIGSVIYHSVMHRTTPSQYKQLLYFDMMGIWVVNTGGALATTQLFFPCAELWLKAAIAVGPSMISIFWIVFIAKTPASRAAAFAVQLLARLGLFFASVTLSLTHWTPALLAIQILVEGVTLTGAIVNVIRVPEKWYPGRFDYFQSHTIMHICVAIGILSQHPLGLSRSAWIESDIQSMSCIKSHHSMLSDALGL